MKKLIIIFILCSYCAFYIQAQIIQGNDTLYLNYFIAAGELGGINEGLIIHGNSNEIKAKSVRYNNSSYGMALKIDTIIDFYEKNKSNYTIIKAEWVLNEKQRDYIAKILDEIKKRPVEKNIFNNATEHYTILTNKEKYVFIDRAGNWNKFLEIKKVLNIEQHSKKL